MIALRRRLAGAAQAGANKAMLTEIVRHRLPRIVEPELARRIRAAPEPEVRALVAEVLEELLPSRVPDEAEER